MGVVTFGNQMNDRSILVSHSIVVCIPQNQNTSSRREINIAVRVSRKIHRLCRTLKEYRLFVSSTVSICILKPENTIMLQAIIIIRWKVCVTLHYQDFTILSHCNTSWRC